MTAEIQHWSDIGHLTSSCPFCDSADQVLTVGDKEEGLPVLHQVFCQNCGASGPVGDTFGTAILYWNDTPAVRDCAMN